MGNFPPDYVCLLTAQNCGYFWACNGILNISTDSIVTRKRISFHYFPSLFHTSSLTLFHINEWLKIFVTFQGLQLCLPFTSTPKYSRWSEGAASPCTVIKKELWYKTANHLETTGILLYGHELQRLTANVLCIFGAYPIDRTDVQCSRLPFRRRALNKLLSSLGSALIITHLIKRNNENCTSQKDLGPRFDWKSVMDHVRLKMSWGRWGGTGIAMLINKLISPCAANDFSGLAFWWNRSKQEQTVSSRFRFLFASAAKLSTGHSGG